MQRSKAAAGVEVKRVIGALCRLLAALGLDPVPAPEAFRRAKFGGRPEGDPFWQLLSSILHMSGIISSETSSQLRGELRKLVAAGLWQSGYHADWIYGADAGSFCSRDLLLALGWLLAKGVLETLLAGRVEQLDQTLLSSAPEKPEVSADLELDAASLRRLQWLMGHLRHRGRTLLSTIGARTRALHEVLSSSQVCSAAPSAGRSSAALTEDCFSLQQLCELLDAYVSWKQVEKVFWTWMDSVADRRLCDLRDRTSSQRVSHSLGACHQGKQRLEEMLRGPAQQDVKSGDADWAVASLPPSLSSRLSAPSVHQVCRARLQAEQRLRRPSEGPHGGAAAPGELPAPQAAQLLLQAETELLQRRDRRRLANRKQLQGLMGSLDQQVFIAL
ncbi:tubulin epsilon and delta complex protein 1 isoform X1 [Fundulus heteroclitus]|uniref:tubulin epsilon and delta complex protein 1 isoform X1 n=1 Tax=Fundulus heteroclitus TaxID=8078 RepID=UPI00165C6F22|nr:tubulin epsilon and delta complex protein 1 isoform X1 [Fundulus heteroclitus]